MSSLGDITLQPATKDQADFIPDLIFETDPAVFTCLFDGQRSVFNRWASTLWTKTGTTFSHEYATVARRDGELLGLELGYTGGDEDRLTRKNTAESIELLDKDALAVLRVAMRSGIGYLTPRVSEKAYYLHFLSVAEPGRNQGIGRRLLENAFERARDDGLRTIQLDVYGDNPAVRLYERMGMKILVETRLPELEREHGIPPHYRMVTVL